MNIVNQKANNVSRSLMTFGASETAALDPMTILTIISIIVQIISMLQKCHVQPKEVKPLIQSPGIFMRRVMRNIIRHNINLIDISRQDIRALTFNIEQAIQKEATQTSIREFELMFNEVKESNGI